MDPITQGLLGGVTAQLGFRQRIGRETTWVATGAAMLPDCDIFVPLFMPSLRDGGHLAMVRVHRGITHSLLLVPVFAAVVALGWWWIRRRRARSDGAAPAEAPPPFALLYGCCFVAILSHPLLDWCTSYGTQMLAPFSDARLALDVMPIVDIFYTPILLLTVLGCFVARKLRPEARRATLLIGCIGFGLSLGYIGAGAALRGAAIRQARQVVAPENGAEYAAYPRLGTILLWRVTRRTPDRWMAFRVRPLFGLPPDRMRRTEAPVVENEWTRKARELPQAKTYHWFARGQTRATYEQEDGRHVVRLHDTRYGVRAEDLTSMWPLEVTFDSSGDLLSVQSVRRTGGRDRRRMIQSVWEDIWSP